MVEVVEVEGVTAESSVTAAGLRAKGGGAGGDASQTTMPCCVRLWRKVVNRAGRKTDSSRLFAPCTYRHFHRVRLLLIADGTGCPLKRRLIGEI